MLEPIIRKLPKSDKITGTPANKIVTILSIAAGVCSSLIVYGIAFSPFFRRMREKNKWELTELEKTKEFWNHPSLEGVVQEVRRRRLERELEARISAASSDIKDKTK